MSTNSIKHAKAHKVSQVTVNGSEVATLQARTAVAYSQTVSKIDKNTQQTKHKLDLAAFAKVIELSEEMADSESLTVTLVIEAAN